MYGGQLKEILGSDSRKIDTLCSDLENGHTITKISSPLTKKHLDSRQSISLL